VAELRGVLDVVNAGDGVVTTDQVRAVVARKAVPRSRKGRSRLTEGEARELDERELDRDIAAADGIEQVDAADRRSRADALGVKGTPAERIHREVALTKGADDAIFRGGAGINRQRQTGTGDDLVLETVLLPGVTIPSRGVLDAAAVERRVDAQ